MVVAEANFFRRRFMWTVMIIDEGHRLKNEKSQLAEKLRLVPCLSKVILTGTPLQNNLRELWALLHFLAPDVFNTGTSERFETGFDAQANRMDNHMLRQTRKLLGIFMLRRLKDHIAITLPSRKELTVLVPLTDKQTSLYKRVLCGVDPSALENASASGAQGDGDWKRLMNMLLQLRKVCNHTYLMPGVSPSPYQVTEDIIQGSGKLLMLDRMLPQLRQDGHRVLIFSQFTRCVLIY